MSRVGRKPIPIPEKVSVQVQGQQVKVKGPNGELQFTVPEPVRVEQKDKNIVLTAEGKAPNTSALYGMSRARIANLVDGVTGGFKKDLEIVGLGYKAALQGQKLVLNLGFSHPVEFALPQGVKIEIDKKATKVTVSGIDKDLVGQTAARIRSIKTPEPYKGTGIRYAGERVHRKAGKTAAGAGGGGKK